MRTFAAFVMAGILGLTLGCGDSGSSGGSSYTSPTGRTASSGGMVCKNQTCPAEEAYYACLASKCNAQAQACFGPAYASGSFSGSCAALVGCTMDCPCDATGDLCIAGCAAAVTMDCMTCSAGVQACAAASGCQQATCAGDAAVIPPTGTGCAAAQACCATLAGLGTGAALAAQQCQAAVAAAGTTEAICDQIVTAMKAEGYCL